MTFNEEAIRPAALFNSYLSLTKQDCKEFFSPTEFKVVSCPCCHEDKKNFSKMFAADGFTYVHCNSCASIYVNPRPDPKAIARFYEEGQSVKFWATDFYKTTAEQRRIRTWRPKAEKLANDIKCIFKDTQPKVQVFDVGAGYGIMLEELKSLLPSVEPIAIEPSPGLAAHLRTLGLRTIQKFFDKVEMSDTTSERGDTARVFCSFELIEHLLEPEEFFMQLYRFMRPGDILNFTTLSASGFDILYLGEESNALRPPHHLTFFSNAALTKVLTKIGFQILRFETPGELDADIVAKSEKFKRDLSMQALLGTEGSRKAFQEFLKENKLSSHINVLCQK